MYIICDSEKVHRNEQKQVSKSRVKNTETNHEKMKNKKS